MWDMEDYRLSIIFVLAMIFACWNDAHSATVCDAGVMLGHKAYMEGTYDAQRTDMARVHYLVDAFGDMMVIMHDRAAAHRSVDYIARRVKMSGTTYPNDAMTYDIAQDFAAKECWK